VFSREIEYALRAVIHLASVAPACRTTEQIAADMRMPPAYLAKVLRRLVRTGTLRSRKGLGGGMSLALHPEELTILAVVGAMAPLRRMETHALGLDGSARLLGSLRRYMESVLALVEAEFARTTIAELVDPARPTPPQF
jgi:Rrf2 family nitric oxide-sensitive transcriptional repressor